MPYVCAVAECRNRNGPDLAFHRFPSHDKVRCKKWEVKCKRLDKLNVANARVCAAHFTDEDYERDLQNELLGLPLRKKLKPTAIPSIFMERFPGTSSKRETRQKNRISRKLVNEILENTTLETGINPHKLS
ncbi:unnamed protein product [Orchesella dallaii]|uniref:THAP-type domain-containing protein n=1 Tax=Orchesella dallaii TaxID=48710 RepID=A0ABP1R5X1_9HEXA